MISLSLAEIEITILAAMLHMMIQDVTIPRRITTIPAIVALDVQVPHLLLPLTIIAILMILGVQYATVVTVVVLVMIRHHILRQLPRIQEPVVVILITVLGTIPDGMMIMIDMGVAEVMTGIHTAIDVTLPTDVRHDSHHLPPLANQSVSLIRYQNAMGPKYLKFKSLHWAMLTSK